MQRKKCNCGIDIQTAGERKTGREFETCKELRRQSQSAFHRLYHFTKAAKSILSDPHPSPRIHTTPSFTLISTFFIYTYSLQQNSQTHRHEVSTTTTTTKSSEGNILYSAKLYQTPSHTLCTIFELYIYHTPIEHSPYIHTHPNQPPCTETRPQTQSHRPILPVPTHSTTIHFPTFRETNSLRYIYIYSSVALYPSLHRTDTTVLLWVNLLCALCVLCRAWSGWTPPRTKKYQCLFREIRKIVIAPKGVNKLNSIHTYVYIYEFLRDFRLTPIDVFHNRAKIQSMKVGK